MVSPLATSAVRFCLLGACERVYKSEYKCRQVETRLMRVIGSKDIAKFNDTSSHAQVLRAVKKANI
jgi:hypothetical protein